MIKKIGVMNGRELYRVIFRKENFAEDFREWRNIIESTDGKRKFCIDLEGFSMVESESVTRFILDHNIDWNANSPQKKVAIYNAKLFI